MQGCGYANFKKMRGLWHPHSEYIQGENFGKGYK